METINYAPSNCAVSFSPVPPPYLDPEDDVDLPFGPSIEPPANLVGSVVVFDSRLGMNLLMPVFAPKQGESRIGLGSELLTPEQVRFLIDLLESALWA